MIVIGPLPYWELGFPADACLPTAHHPGQGGPAGCGWIVAASKGEDEMHMVRHDHIHMHLRGGVMFPQG